MEQITLETCENDRQTPRCPLDNTHCPRFPPSTKGTKHADDQLKDGKTTSTLPYSHQKHTAKTTSQTTRNENEERSHEDTPLLVSQIIETGLSTTTEKKNNKTSNTVLSSYEGKSDFGVQRTDWTSDHCHCLCTSVKHFLLTNCRF